MDDKRSLAAIDELIDDYNYLQSKLLAEEPSLAQNITRHLTKMLVMSCASHYEHMLINALVCYSQEHSKKYKTRPQGFDILGKYSFFKMFDFGRSEPNKARAFLKPLEYFGNDFKNNIVNEVLKDAKTEEQMNAFQEICTARNSLAHNDLIIYDDALSNKSFTEIKALHDKALRFVYFLTDKFV